MTTIEESQGPPAARRRFEIVERKGLGHPDSICDAVMEEAARALARAYLDRSGKVEHFNLDKALLAAGRSSPRFGGGSLDEPIRFVFGDRAVHHLEDDGGDIPVTDIVEEAARQWFSSHLRFIDPDRDVSFQSELRAGSAELVGVYGAAAPRANDTSFGVGFAPLTETEMLVVEAERYLNGKDLKSRFPATGEDAKVLGVRRDRALELTVALAFVDRFVESEASYFRIKSEVEADLDAHLLARLDEIDELTIRVNTLDAPGRGEDGTYLTVTGTSGESADSGEVGRGNGLTGFSSATRPSSAEAVSGKNPLCHVGKIYNHLAQRAALRIAAIDGVAEANVFLVSRIGAPIDEPQFDAVQVVLHEGCALGDRIDAIETIVTRTLKEAETFVSDWLERRVMDQTP